MEKKKKAGMKEIKKKLSEILMNDSISLIQRLNRLYDDDIQSYLGECLDRDII